MDFGRDFETLLLALGVLLLLVGLVHKIEIKGVHLSTDNKFIRAVLCLIGVLFIGTALNQKMHFLELLNKTEFFIVAYSTPFKDEAIKYANSLSRKGLKSEVYSTAVRQFAVTMGPYQRKEAERIKEKAIKADNIRGDAFLTAQKKLLVKIYPDSSNVEDINEKDFFIVAKSTPSKEEAINFAKSFLQKGYESEVHSTARGQFAVTIGHYPSKKAQYVKEQAIKAGNLTQEAYLVTELGLLKIVYPDSTEIPNNKELFIIVHSTQSQERAIEYAKLLRSNYGYESEVYSSASGRFAVTIGHYPKDRAQYIKNQAIKAGKISKDAYLVTDMGLITKIYDSKDVTAMEQ